MPRAARPARRRRRGRRGVRPDARPHADHPAGRRRPGRRLAGRRRVRRAAPAGEPVGAVALTPVAGGPPLVELARGRRRPSSATAPDVPSATVLRADPSAGEAAVAGGASASVTLAGDLRGLAAASCRPPSADAWLVGGSTEIGSSALLVVANPGPDPRRGVGRRLRPHRSGRDPGRDLPRRPGRRARPAPRGRRRRAAPPRGPRHRGGRARLGPPAGQPARRLHARRAPTSSPRVRAPSTRQVLSGLVVRRLRGRATEDAAQVRLLATGRRARHRARSPCSGRTGRSPCPGADRLELGPGEVTDVSLAGLPAGPYTAVVDVGRARSSRARCSPAWGRRSSSATSRGRARVGRRGRPRRRWRRRGPGRRRRDGRAGRGRAGGHRTGGRHGDRDAAASAATTATSWPSSR